MGWGMEIQQRENLDKAEGDGSRAGQEETVIFFCNTGNKHT